MVQDLPHTTVKSCKRVIHMRHRSWLGLAKSCEPSILYRSREHFGLQLLDLREFRKRLRTARAHILKHSSDKAIRNLYAYVLLQERKSRKVPTSLKKFIPPSKKKTHAPPCMELEAAENYIQRMKFIGHTQVSKRGLACNPIKRKDTNSSS